MFTSLCQFGLGVAVAFSGNYYCFVVLRFLLAMVRNRAVIPCNSTSAGWGRSRTQQLCSMHFPDLQ